MFDWSSPKKLYAPELMVPKRCDILTSSCPAGILSIEWPFIILVDLKVAVVLLVSEGVFSFRMFIRSSCANIPRPIRERRKVKVNLLILLMLE